MAEQIEQLDTPFENPPQATYKRFGAGERFEHILAIVTFTGLALTGIPQKYAGQDWAQTMIGWIGGIESIRILHRIFAVVLMAEVIYHGGIVTYKLFVLGRKASMWIGIRDLRDVLQWIAFNLGLRRDHPNMPRYNFGEKAEYLAFVWGTVVMIITGFMLWNPIATTQVLPGEAVPAALAAHSGEALLAVLAIIVWHFYNVHFKHLNRSMFTGSITHKEMVEEHGEELAQILAGDVPQDPPAEVINQRMKYFVSYAFAVSTVLIMGLMWFITFEDTAITTIDPIAVDNTEITVSADVGEVNEGLVVYDNLECAECHGAEADGMPGTLNIPIATTHLSFEEFVYQTRRGPADMPSYNSRSVSDEDLAHIYAWLQSLES